MPDQPRNVAILIFEEVEVLDFAGPFEVFNVTAEQGAPPLLNVYTVAETAAPVKARGRLSINPNYPITALPPTDILLVPGGFGTRALLNRPDLLAWLRSQAEQVEYLCSVCTGSLVLGKAGLLAGLRVTTHHTQFDLLRSLVDDTTTVVETERYIDNGKVLTSGGVSAGIDMALYLVQTMFGDEVLRATLNEMEYPYIRDRALRWQAAAES